LGLPIFLVPSGLVSDTFLTVLRFSIQIVMLLGSDPVDTFPRQRIRRQESDNFRCYATAL
jgi:hypothetical protein